MRGKRFILVLGAFLAISCMNSLGEEVYHRIEYSTEATVDLQSGDALPFFMSANHYGILSPQGSQGYLREKVQYQHQKENKKFYWEAGLDLIGYLSSHYDYYRRNCYLQQIYAEMGGGQYFLSLGSKERPARFVNQELSSGNMTWSNNARPIPGIHFGTKDFVKMFIVADLLESSFDFFYGKMLDGHYNNNRFDQYVALGEAGPLRSSVADGAYIHRKSVFLRTPSKYPIYVTGGIEHVAVFGGNVRCTNGVWDGDRYIATFDQTCKWGNALMGGDGDPDDALNHLMTIDARIDLKQERFEIGLYKQHYTDDLNSKSFTNFADGLWGVELRLRRTPWLEYLVVEYIKTDSQGDNTEAIRKITSGEEPLIDDFASDFYQDQRFGAYAYYGMTCGNPMVKSPIYNADSYPGFLNNNLHGFHVGAKGSINRDLSYVFKCCSIKSDGSPWTSALEKLAGLPVTTYTDTSFLLELSYNYSKWDFVSQISWDKGNLMGDSFGFGLSAKYSGSFLKAVWK